MDLISSGDLKPGERLPAERELCVQFGASRSSLREALRCLSIVGVLNARVGEGTSVAVDGGKFLRKITEWRLITERHDIENLLKVRMALEGMSAAETAIHGTKEDIDVLRELLEKMRASIQDEARFAALDLEFHVAIANASGNALLSDLTVVIRGQLARAMHEVLHLPHALPLSYREHRRIVAGIARHDADAASEAMQAHLKAHLRRFADATGNGSALRKAKGHSNGGRAMDRKMKALA